MADQYRNSLSIRERGRAIPYADPHRSERGFKNLKSCPPLIAALPCLDPAMAMALAAINAPGTGLFSVACGSVATHLDRGRRFTGYIEFALNSQRDVQDPANYFTIFLRFDRWLRSHRFTRAALTWEIEEAEFIGVGISGFTCAVFVKTDFVDSAAKARDDWEKALAILGQNLGTFRGPEDDPIYESAPFARPLGGLAPSIGPVLDTAINGNGRARA